MLFVAILFLSFAGVWIYSFSPEAKTFMEKINPDLDLEMLLRSAFMSLAILVTNIYLFYFVIFDLIIRNKINIKRAFTAILIIILYVFLALFISKLSSYTDETKLSIKILPNLLITLLFGGVGLGIRALVENFNEKEKRKELERKNLENEINLLRSQINPHFLFNTLNNIDAMIRKDPEKASDLLIKLSVQMRYMLYDSNTKQIDMESELQFINDYIDLQKLRLKNPDAVEFTIKGDYAHSTIPPMLFIPYIENAFKHCSDVTADKSIQFEIQLSEKELYFQSKNRYDKEVKVSKDKTGGIGISLAKKRLDLLYPNTYQLQIEEKEGWYKVELQIENGQ